MSLQDLVSTQNPWWIDPQARLARRYPVRRDLQRRLLDRMLLAREERAVVVLGPRQVGKTVALQQTVDDLLDEGWSPRQLVYFDFKDDRALTEAVTPRAVVERAPTPTDERFPRVFFFDEIGAAPAWDRWLRAAVDAGTSRIVATDSAATILRDGGRESGLGRWDEWTLEGLTFREFARIHSGVDVEAALVRTPNLVERYLLAGGFPEHAVNDDLSTVRQRLRKDSADRAILRDLLSTGVDVGRLRKLFVYLMKDSGAIFVAAERGQQDLDADARTVQGWLTLLYETMLVVPLERHVTRASGTLRGRPKVYASDHGLVFAFADDPSSPEVRGRAFEAIVFRHLRGIDAEIARGLRYYRSRRGDLETDFVLDGGRVVLEVTSRTDVDREKRARLARVAKRTGAERAIIVHGGIRQSEVEGVTLLPLAPFLMDPSLVVERLG